MSLAKKSTKWLVLAILVFALVLTAFFAVGNVARASAEDDPDLIDARVIVVGSATNNAGYPSLLPVACTVTADYYVEISANSGSLGTMFFAPVLVLPNGTEVKPTDIALNNELQTSGKATISFVSEYLAAQDPTDAFNIDVNGSLSDIRGFSETTEGSKVFRTNVALFSATYTIAADAAAGEYTFRFSTDSEARNQFSIDDIDNYVPVMMSGDFEVIDGNNSDADITSVAEGNFTKRAAVAVPTVTSGFVFDATEKTALILDTDEDPYFLQSGNVAATAFGDYSFTLRLLPDFYWDLESVDSLADYTSDKTFNWFIAKKQVTVPVSAGTTYTYNGQDQTFEFTTDPLTDAAYITLANNVKSAAGEYTVTAALKYPDSTYWGADTTDVADKTYEFVINPALITVPTPANVTYTFNKTEQSFQWADTPDELITITGTPQTAAGEYTITVSIPENYAWNDEGHTTADKTFPFVIAKKSVTVPSLDTSHFTYNGEEKSVGLVQAVADEGYIAERSTGTTWSATNAGEYAVKVGLQYPASTYWGDDTTDTEDKTLNWDIAKVQVTKPTPLSGVQYVYDSYNKQFMLDVVSAETGYYTISNNIRRNAGTQTVTVSLKDKSNTQWADGTTADLEFTFTVQRRPVNLSVSADAASHVYGDTPANVSISATGIIDAFTCSYKVVCVDGEAPYAEYTPTQFNEGLNAGHYTLNPVYNDINGNYDVTVSEPFSYEITKKQVSIPKAVSGLTFNGSEQEGVVNDDNSSLYDLGDWDMDDFNLADGSAKGTAAGNYTATFALEDTDNTEWANAEAGEEITNKTIAWYIDYVLVTKPTATTTTYVYNGSEKTYAFASAGDSNRYTVANNKRTNAGTQTVTATLSNANYKWADGTTAALEFPFTVKKASVIAAACSLDNTFTYTGGEITCNFISEGQQSYFTITGHKQTNVGTYDVTETLNDPDNYKWSHFPNVSDDEPTAPYVQENAFEITKKAVTIPTAISGLRYTGSDQLGVNKVDGSFYELVSGGVETATAVGNYTATYSLKSTTNSYWAGNVDDVANKTVNWSIGKAQITKPTIEVSYKTYNGEAQTYSGSGTGYTFTGSGTNFGTYPVTVSLTDTTTTEWNDGTTADYEDADKLSIAKKSVTLTITKSASSSEYGSSVATITVSASGLIAENDLGTLSYQAKYSNGGSYVYYTKAQFEGTTPYPVAKDYILEPVYTENANYYVSASSSPYTINKKSVTIAFSKASYTSVYGEPLEEISIAAYGLVNEGDLGTVSYVIMKNEQFVELVNVGQYSLVNTYSANPNYTVTQAGYATYTITTKQVVKPAQDNRTFTYNGNAQTYNLATSSDYTITGTTTKTDAGSNNITIALNDKDNTAWSTGGTADVEYTFTINKKAVTLDFYDSDDEEPWHLTFVATYPDSLYYITVKATGLINDGDLGELGFTATNDETHAVADITVAGAPAGYYTLTPTYTPNANYDVTALQGTARIYVLSVPVPVVVTDTYYYDGTAKAIVFDEVASQGYSQYYTITGNSLTEPGTTTVTVALKDEYAGNVIWGYDERVETIIDTTDDQTFTLTVNASVITVTFTYSYGEAVTTIAEDVEVNFVNDAMRALPSFRFFKTAGWKYDNSIVTGYTIDMDGKTLNAEFTYAIGAGDADGDGFITANDVLQMKRTFVGLDKANKLANAAAAWAAVKAGTDPVNPVMVSALDVNNSGAYRTNDIVAVREALATGYAYKVMNLNGIRQVVKQDRVTVTTYADFVEKVAAGYPIQLGDNISAATEDYNGVLDVPADIDLNGWTLTVNSFTMTNAKAGATLKITGHTTNGGNIYTVEGISITAPAGNVVVSNVNGYTYEGEEVILAAYTSSLHIEQSVGFYQYKVEGKATAEDYKETVTTNDAIDGLALTPETGIIAQTEAQIALMAAKKTAVAQNDEAKAAKQAEVAAITDTTSQEYTDAVAQLNALIDTGNTLSAQIAQIPVFKAPVNIPVDTHVVVESNANLKVEQITVVAPAGADTTVSTFSVNVKNDEAEVIKVDIQAVKEIVNQVTVYHVDEVALEGETQKVEIIAAEDQTVAETTLGIKTYAELADALDKGGKIVIGKDITSTNGYIVTKDAEIDLNGFTITVETGATNQKGTTNNNRAFKIAEGVSFAMYNGTVDALGGKNPGATKSNASAGYGTYGAIRAEKGSTIDLHDITVKNYRPWAMNLKLLAATATLDHVTIISEYGGGIELSSDTGIIGTVYGYASLTNCVMTQSGYHDWNSSPFAVSGNATMDVYSTSYVGESAAYVFSSGGTINIHGGSFTALSHGVFETTSDPANYSTSANINVYGGTFKGPFDMQSTTNGLEHINIFGGTFDHDPTAYVPAGFVGNVSAEDGIYTVAPITGAAYIGNTTYESFEAAVTAAQDGDTIGLLDDVTFGTTHNVDIWTNKAFNINLNGKTLTTESTQARFWASAICYGDDETTIRNVKVYNGTIITAQATGVYLDGAVNGTFEALTIDASIVRDCPDDVEYSAAVRVTYRANAIINSGKYTGTKALAVSNSGGHITVNGGVFKGAIYIAANTDKDLSAAAKTITINGGLFEGCTFELKGAGYINICGGTFKGAIVINDTSNGKGYLNICGGTFYQNPTAYVDTEYYTVTKGKDSDKVDIWTVAPKGAARIGSTVYQTLDAAINAAGDDDTIVLLKNTTYGTTHENIAIEDGVSIDLNGLNVICNSENNKTVVPNQTNRGYKASAVSYSSDYAVKDVTVSNGTIRTTYGTGVYIDGLRMFATLSNLDVESNTAGTMGVIEYSSAVRATCEAHVTINSGVYKGYHAVAVSNSGGYVTINGGNFNGRIYFSTNGAKAIKSITIKGGTFRNVQFTNKDYGNLYIRGGSFDIDPTPYLDDTDGYTVTHNSSTNLYTVAPKKVGNTAGVARVGSTIYTSLEAAVTAVPEGGTVVMLKDVTYDEARAVPVWSKSFNIDLNGLAFTTHSTVGVGVPNAGYKTSAFCYDSATAPLTISNGTIISTSGTGVYSATNTTFTLSGLTVVVWDGENYAGDTEYCSAVRITEMGNVTINSGLYTGYYALVVSNSGGTMTVNGGNFNGKIYFSTNGAKSTKTITINGGTFTNVEFVNKDSGNLTITGGSFDIDPTGYIDTNSYKVTYANGMYTVSAK